jgi:hypothetical protein
VKPSFQEEIVGSPGAGTCLSNVATAVVRIKGRRKRTIAVTVVGSPPLHGLSLLAQYLRGRIDEEAEIDNAQGEAKADE